MSPPPKVAVSITREDKSSGGRYLARVEGKPAAEMTFSKAGGRIPVVDQTGMPDELGGIGVGKALADHMVHHVRVRALRAVLPGPCTSARLRKHPDWQDVLKDPF